MSKRINPLPIKRARDGGFALLIVLWGLVPVALLFLSLAASARSDLRAAAGLRDAASLEAAADGAIATAVFDVLATGEAEDGPRRLRLPGADVIVETDGLSGLVNPNTASPELLAALLVRLGAADEQARRTAAAMVDWRTPGQQSTPNGAKAADYRRAGLDYGPPGAPFESLEELGFVLGMTPRLLASATPLMSLYTYGDPDPARAAPVVRQALADIGVRRSTGPLTTQVLQITAEATAADRSKTVREAVIRFGPGGDGRGWRVLAWHTRFGT